MSIEIVAVLEKKDIAAVGACKGKTNSDIAEIGGHVHPAGTLVFECFAGRRNSNPKLDDGRFHGVLRFAPCSAVPGNEPGRCGFAELLKFTDIDRFASNHDTAKKAVSKPRRNRK